MPIGISLASKQELTAGDYIRRAIERLNQGKEKSAREDLLRALVRFPNSKQAKDLLAQIDSDPVELLGDQSFPYRVAVRETLYDIAKRFMGDGLNYYALARYNGILVPSNVPVGKWIRVPRKNTQTETDTKKSQRNASLDQSSLDASPDQLAHSLNHGALQTVEMRVRKAYQINNFALVTKLFNAHGVVLRNTPELRELLIRSHMALAKSALAEHRMSASRVEHTLAMGYLDDNPNLESELIQLGNQIAAETHFRQGLGLEAKQKVQDALLAMESALKVMPDHPGAMLKRDKLREFLVDRNHKDAVAAFRAQELESSIALWGRVLALNPEHSSAALMRSRAKRLLRRVRAID